MKSNDGAIFGGGEIGIKHFANPAILINPDHHRENQTLVNQTPVDFSQERIPSISDDFWVVKNSSSSHLPDDLEVLLFFPG